jgi:hypothetical protein
LALGERGEVFSWGRGTWGQTGHNSMTNTNQPLQIQALIQEHIVQVSLLLKVIGIASLSLCDLPPPTSCDAEWILRWKEKS